MVFNRERTVSVGFSRYMVVYRLSETHFKTKFEANPTCRIFKLKMFPEVSRNQNNRQSQQLTARNNKSIVKD